MQTLLPEQYGCVETLFQPLNFHLAVPAVIQSATPGTIYVDDPLHPRSALMRVHHRFYLAGDADNAAFAQALNQLFTGVIYPAAAGEGGYTFNFSPGWAQRIETDILAGLDPIPVPREHYRFDRLRVDWRDLLPPGFTLRLVDAGLVGDSTLVNREDLLEELQSERSTVAEFLERSFGFVLVEGQTLAGWCLSEYNLGRSCEIGIATDPAYRRRGLGTLTGAAFVEHALAQGVDDIGWDCWASNRPSSATALKIGFKQEHAYPSYFALYNSAINRSYHGDILLDQGRYDEALIWLERGIQTGGAPEWAYIDAAGACARLGDSEAAFRYLNDLVRQGFRNAGWLMHNTHLQSLHDLPAWQALLADLNAE